MRKSEYFPPQIDKGEFHCPHCHVYAKQSYAHLGATTHYNWSSIVDHHSNFAQIFSREWIVTKCERCNKFIIWNGSDIIFPKASPAPPPNEDMSDEIKKYYREAANVLADSPRAAAALLRLSLQKLCVQLGEKGENINEDIKSLVKKGLNPLIQQSLDALRITGNNAVHPGEINIEEEPDRVIKLFGLLNFISEKMLTEPKEISAFYERLPEGARTAVNKRDGNE